VSRKGLEACFHFCPRCKKDFFHTVPLNAVALCADWERPCLTCEPDVVAQIILKDQRRVDERGKPQRREELPEVGSAPGSLDELAEALQADEEVWSESLGTAWGPWPLACADEEVLKQLRILPGDEQ